MYSNKRIMILGAGIYQLPLIRTAKKMGIYTIVVSVPGNYPGFKVADEIVLENTTDKERILEIAREKKIDGIVVCGTDVCVPTQGFVCDNLHLKGPRLDSTLKAQDKSLMKKAFVKHGVRTASVKYVSISNESPVEECEELGYPVIFKSIDSSGSRGITKVNSAEEIEYAYSQVLNNTKSNNYIIEKYLTGVEFGAQAFVYEGEVRFILPHGDYVYQGDTGVPVGHFAPYLLDSETENDVKEQLNLAIKALELDNCAINADFIMCNGKTYVLEIGARAGATCLAEMTSIYYGFNYYEKIIEVALGGKADFSVCCEKPQANVEVLLISEREGVLTDIRLPLVPEDVIQEISFDYKVGDRIPKFEKGPDRIGNVIAIGHDVDDAKNNLMKFVGEMIIEVDGKPIDGILKWI